MKVAPEIKAKDPKTTRSSVLQQTRVELPPKLTGEFTYAHDVRVPGMLHGRVVRPPTITSKPASIDESSVKNIPGIVKVVQEGKLRRRRGYNGMGGNQGSQGVESYLVRAGDENARERRRGLRLPQKH